MHGLFQAVAGRLKALFVTQVALDLEAELLTQDAARKAALLRQAEQYAADGLDDVAVELRERVGRLSLDRPLASVLPAFRELGQPLGEPLAALPSVATPVDSAIAAAVTKRRKPR